MTSSGHGIPSKKVINFAIDSGGGGSTRDSGGGGSTRDSTRVQRGQRNGCEHISEKNNIVQMGNEIFFNIIEIYYYLIIIYINSFMSF